MMPKHLAVAAAHLSYVRVCCACLCMQASPFLLLLCHADAHCIACSVQADSTTASCCSGSIALQRWRGRAQPVTRRTRAAALAELAALVVEVFRHADGPHHRPRPPAAQQAGREDDGVERHVVLAHKLHQLHVFGRLPPGGVVRRARAPCARERACMNARATRTSGARMHPAAMRPACTAAAANRASQPRAGCGLTTAATGRCSLP